jgi:hypothetical protein
MAKSTKEKKREENQVLMVLILIGILVSLVLVLISTGFEKYMHLFRPGFVITDSQVTASLSMDPMSEDIKHYSTMTPFEELQYIYRQGTHFFIGEKKKSEIYSAYPLYLKEDRCLQLIDDSATLYTSDFEQAETYKGMLIQDGSSYNPGGEKADAAFYYFLALSNGNHINLTPISYTYKGVEYVVPVNSVMHFDKKYLSYYEVEDENMYYHSIPLIALSEEFNIDDYIYTYEELLRNLNIIHDPIKGETIIPAEEVVKPEEEVMPPEELKEKETDDNKETVEPKIPDPPAKPEAAPAAVRPPKENTTPPGSNTDPGTNGDREDMGVRPDSMRPDKYGDDTPTVQEYVKPEVQVNGYTVGVYRIMVDLAVKDPAARLHKSKKVQVEIYEVDSKGNQTLVMRSYKGAPGGVVTLGDGMVKPSTKYYVQTYFTYYDEYDVQTVEMVDAQYFTTRSLDELGEVILNQQPGEALSNQLTIENISFAEGSDPEAVYGIASAGGIKLNLKAPSYGYDSDVDMNRSNIGSFKKGGNASVSSKTDLKPRTEYNYTLSAVDYFGNPIVLVNNTGTMTTSKETASAEISVEKNEIADIVLSFTLSDPDYSIVPKDGSQSDVNMYFVICPSGENLPSSEEEMANASYYTKLAASDYTYTPLGNGYYEFKLTGDKFTTSSITNLDLDTSYTAAVITDYDLENGRGPKRFMPIGKKTFVSAGLSSLGSIYVSAKASGITEDSASLTFELNTARTNEQLYKLISSFNVVLSPTSDDKEGRDPLATSVGFDASTQTAGGDSVLELFKAGTAFGTRASNLESMTEYYLTPSTKCTYNGKEYDIKTILDLSNFKTLKKAPIVNIIDPVFAGGHIVFDASVIDEDGTIIGNSGNTVVVSLYKVVTDSQGNESLVFVRKTRIEKSTDRDNPIITEVDFPNLDSSSIYKVVFTAVEYNNAYTNDTYVANKEIGSYTFNSPIDFTGTIRLQDLKDVGKTSVYQGDLKVEFNDPHDRVPQFSEGEGDYYVKLIKNDDLSSARIYGYAKDADVDTIDVSYDFDRGENEYKVQLLVKIGERELLLDEISFTTEQPIKGFSNEYEFLHYVQQNPKGKYIAKDNITLYSNHYYTEDGDAGTSQVDGGILANCVVSDEGISLLNAKVSFQGYTFEHHIMGDGQRLFTNIGPDGEISNVKYDVYFDSPTVLSEEGALCYRNYGVIRDIYVDYKGGNTLANTYIGLLCRSNTSSGIIENFVIHNNPEEGKSGFSAKNYAGLVCYTNYGIVRNGYAYGDDLYCDFYTRPANMSSNVDRYLGGLVGYNCAIGQMENVYTLLGIDMETFTGEWPGVRFFGTITGRNLGSVNSMYTTGTINDPSYHSGPAVGYADSAKRCNNVYYYHPNSAENFTNTYNVPIDVSALYDSGWQAQVLGGEFNQTNVELGYYPHVNLSSTLPEQEYIPLPGIVNNGEVELSQSEVISYDNTPGSESAYVKFRFLNRYNADISALTIENLSVKLDLSTEESADGYTVIYGTVYNPTVFKSEYKVKRIDYTADGRAGATNYSAGNEPILRVDFFRSIYTVDDWYTYVVQNAARNPEDEENVRLQADIDFSGMTYINRVRVASQFGFILDGNGHKISNIDFQRFFNAGGNGSNNSLFYNIDYSGKIQNLVVENYKAGGVSPKGYTGIRPSMVYNLNGSLDNVHLINADFIGYDRMGMVGYAAYANITNCTVNNMNILFKIPDNLEATTAIGGIVGYADNSRISNCYVKGINVEAQGMRAANGIGGAAGYLGNSVIENVYAVGNITARCNNVGGVIGQYSVPDTESIVCARNLLSKVNIICYTDNAGGLIGMANITNNMITDTNNASGVAYGNVYMYNPESEGVSPTVGRAMARPVKYYGCDFQLICGIKIETPTSKYDSSCLGLLTYDEVTNADTYTTKAGMTSVYNYSPVADGNMPHLYYEDSSVELPYQGADGFDEITINDLIDLGVVITDVFVDTNMNLIRIDVTVPAGSTVEDVVIDDLVYTVDSIQAVNGSNEKFNIFVKYEQEVNQNKFFDSYVLSKLKINGAYAGVAARIPLILYKDIATPEGWNAISKDYENYRVVIDIDFNSFSGYNNKRIGRLVGRNPSNPGTQAVLSNIVVNSDYSNFITQLNSNMSNIVIENARVNTKGKDCVGLVGSSYGDIFNCGFNNIDITYKESTARNYMGIICFQNGGTTKDITIDDVKVGVTGTYHNISYVGTLFGATNDIGSVENIQVENCEVYGKQYIGGLAGFTGKLTVTDVIGRDLTVTGTSTYVGGLFGRLGNANTTGSAKVSNARIYGRITNEGETVAIAERLTDQNGYTTNASEINDLRANATSTTTITGTGYVGGIAGYSHESSGNNGISSGVNNQNFAMLVQGVRVNGTTDYVGGAVGYSYANGYMYHIDVNDTYVSGKSAAGNVYLGGVFGAAYYRTGYNNVRNIYVDGTNYSSVGGVIGRQHYHDVIGNMVEDITVDARTSSTSSVDIKYIGGIAGASTYSVGIRNNILINSVVEAPDADSVGGVIGYNSVNAKTYGAYIDRNQVLGKLEGTTGTSAAKSVAAYYVKGGTNVGGIAGTQNGCYMLYNMSNINVEAVKADGNAGGLAGYYNNSYTQNSNNTKTYSTSRCYNNYFAGTVKSASGYAGGMFGGLGLITENADTTGTRTKGNNASYDENDLTYCNVIMPYSIDGANANAIAGASADFNAKGTRIWADTLINGANAYNATAYSTWNPSLSSHISYTTVVAPLLFQSDDLKEYRFFYNLRWITSTTATGNYITRLMLPNWRVGAASYGYTAIPANKYYLPQFRVATNVTFASDTAMRNMRHFAFANQYYEAATASTDATIAWLPIPGASQPFALRMMAMRPSGVNSVADVYASGIDTVNIEFPANYVCEEEDPEFGNYIKVVAGDKVLYEGFVKERVYTFKYDFKTDIAITYSYAYKEYGSSDLIVEDYDAEMVESNSLVSHIMVYKDKYYYINDGDVVSGNSSSSSVMGGDYIHLYRGKALDGEGNIYSLTDNALLGKITENSLTDTASYMSYDYSGYKIDSYHKFSVIKGSNTVVREMQIWIMNQNMYTVSGSLENYKDAMLIYTSSGVRHQTVLMNNGVVADMMAEAPILPEDFDNENIVDMTNNAYATSTYAIVEYADGGKVGYNYLTGEVLFDTRVPEKISFMDYVMNVFTGTKPSMPDISSTYSANANLLTSVKSAEDLNIITGNSNGNITGNSTLENTSSEGVKDSDITNGTANGNGKPEEKEYQEGNNTEKTDGSSEAVNNGNETNGSLVVDGTSAGNATGAVTNYENGFGESGEYTGSGTYVTSGDGSGTALEGGEDGLLSEGDALTNGTNTTSGNAGDVNNQGNKISTVNSEGENAVEKEEDSNPAAGVDSSSGNSSEASGGVSAAAPAGSGATSQVIDISSANKEDTSSKEDIWETKEESIKTSDDADEEVAESVKVQDSNFMVMYNPETGIYEIVDENQFLSDPSYVSENARLGITNIAAFSGYAENEAKTTGTNGLLMYMLIAMLALVGAGGLILVVDKKKKAS